MSLVGRQGVWVHSGRTAGAGAEERVLGTMRRSRGDSVSVGVGVVGVAVAAGAGDEERVLGTVGRSWGDSVSGGVGVVGVVVAAGRHAYLNPSTCR